MDPRRPAVPVAIEDDPDHVLVQNDGSIREHHNLLYTEEDCERIRLGYCCLICGESQVGHGECPMPDNCWLCGFPMKEEQSRRFAQEWVGTVRVGPSTTIDEELAIAEEMLERERFVPSPSIIVPRSW